jgi:hypothetical protein
MKIRFPSQSRANMWRQRFLAIARQVESSADRGQPPVAGAAMGRPKLGFGSQQRVRAEAAGL